MSNCEALSSPWSKEEKQGRNFFFSFCSFKGDFRARTPQKVQPPDHFYFWYQKLGGAGARVRVHFIFWIFIFPCFKFSSRHAAGWRGSNFGLRRPHPTDGLTFVSQIFNPVPAYVGAKFHKRKRKRPLPAVSPLPKYQNFAVSSPLEIVPPGGRGSRNTGR